MVIKEYEKEEKMKKSLLCMSILFVVSLWSLPAADLKIQYRDGDYGYTDNNHIKPHVCIINEGPETIALSDMTLRYYYTKEGTADESFHVDYAAVGNSCVTGTFCNGFLEITFTSLAGELPGYRTSGEIQLRFNKDDWSNYDETDDYSYGSQAVSYMDWEKITLYYKDSLVWGDSRYGSRALHRNSTRLTMGEVFFLGKNNCTGRQQQRGCITCSS
jgi:hypothetical protein